MNSLHTEPISFDSISARYNLCNHLFSLGLDRYWRRQTVHRLSPQPGGQILDLCCGTGDMVFAFARCCNNLSITGVDISEPMVLLARQKQAKLREKNSSNIQWKIADAADTGLPAQSFDIITCAFGLRNIPDRAAALKEMRRLLRPQGKAAILEFDLPKNPLLRGLFWLYLRHFMPLAGLFLFGSTKPLLYLANSIRNWHHSFNLPPAAAQADLDYVMKVPMTANLVTLHLLKKS